MFKPFKEFKSTQRPERMNSRGREALGEAFSEFHSGHVERRGKRQRRKE